MTKIFSAFMNSWRGLLTGVMTERALRQEAILLLAAIPAASFLATGVWVWVALVGVLLTVLVVEFLNTAIEKLCDHITPHHNTTIGFVKDLGSAAVFFTLVLAGLVWLAAIFDRVF